MARGKEAAAAARRREQAALEEVAALKDELKATKAAAAARESELLGEINRLMGDTSGEARAQADASITALRAEHEVQMAERDAYWKTWVKHFVVEMALAASTVERLTGKKHRVRYSPVFYSNLIDHVYDGDADRFMIDLNCWDGKTETRATVRNGTTNMKVHYAQMSAKDRAKAKVEVRANTEARAAITKERQEAHAKLTELRKADAKQDAAVS